MNEEKLWRARITAERAQEMTEWKMMVELQFKSQIERLRQTLDRQNQTNAQLENHIKDLEQEIEGLKSIIEDIE